MKATQSLLTSILVVVGLALSITAHSAGKKGGKTGNGQDTPADVYLYEDGTALGVSDPGIRGDEWLVDGDATLYPANRNLSGPFSCAGAIVTDQAQGYVRMFVPMGNQDGCEDGINRYLRIRSDYDLDQDGLCVIPYEGRINAGSFSRYYACAGPEPDDFEEVMVTTHLADVLGLTSTSTSVGFQIRLLDYGDSYAPHLIDNAQPELGLYDPVLTDIEFIGSQERAFNISLTNGAFVDADPDGDVDARVFYNIDGIVDICQVVWRNAHAKDCEPLEANVPLGMTIAGKVDGTPRDDNPAAP